MNDGWAGLGTFIAREVLRMCAFAPCSKSSNLISQRLFGTKQLFGTSLSGVGNRQLESQNNGHTAPSNCIHVYLGTDEWYSTNKDRGLYFSSKHRTFPGATTVVPPVCNASSW